MRKAILRVTRGVDDILLLISSILLILATVLSVINAILRAVGLGGFTWSDELTVILLIFMVFLSQPFLEYNEKQLSVSILTSSLKTPRARKVFHVIRGIFIIGIIGFLIPYSYQITARAAKMNYLTTVLKWPRFILYAVIVVSFGLIVINWIISLFFKKTGDIENPEETEKQGKEAAGNE
ncbi:MAG: TRAP transporter small permease [Parasporobacterium sp.]|nr:TRAP transporter small permease [Parasporobacterium sp.]